MPVICDEFESAQRFATRGILADGKKVRPLKPFKEIAMYKHFVPIWFLLVLTTNSYAHLGVSGEHADTERDYPSGESHRHKPTGLSANPYTNTLDENTRPGRFVSDLTLTDRDTEEFAVGLAVRGSVSSGLFRWKKGGKYQTGTSTSSIYTNGMLDYETNQSHTVIVTVWDESDKQASLYNDGQNPGAGWHQTTAVNATCTRRG